MWVNKMWANKSTRNNFGRNGSRGRGHPHRTHSSSIPTSVGDAIFQIDEILVKWGVDANSSIAHRRFARRVEDLTADCFLRNILTEWDPIDTSIGMPTNIDEALPLLLEHNLRQVTKDGRKSTVTVTKDALLENHGLHLPFPPYYQVRGETRLSRAYKEFLTPEELDPLRRFSYEEQGIKEFLFGQFSAEPGEEFPPHFVRSLCLYEAVCSYPACLGCNERGSLRWNSSLRTDFCHLICEECDSVYTLRSVADSMKAHKWLDKGNHFGGSYAYFHEIYQRTQDQDISSRNAKMFIIFATRSDPEDSHHLPVYTAEIKGALPNLNLDSFNPERIRIKSIVVFKPHRTPWFTIPVPRDVDISRLSMKVFNDYFDGLDSDESTLAKSESSRHE